MCLVVSLGCSPEISWTRSVLLRASPGTPEERAQPESVFADRKGNEKDTTPLCSYLSPERMAKNCTINIPCRSMKPTQQLL